MWLKHFFLLTLSTVHAKTNVCFSKLREHTDSCLIELTHRSLNHTQPRLNVGWMNVWPAHHWYLAVNPGPVWQDAFDLFSIPLLTHRAKVLHGLRRVHSMNNMDSVFIVSCPLLCRYFYLKCLSGCSKTLYIKEHESSKTTLTVH